MELQFKETRVQACQDLARLSKSVQLAMESVVPDTREDIGHILSVWPEIYLKNKESRNKSVVFGGEAVVTVMYINENESSVSSFSMTQSFRQEYELPSAEENDFLQLRFNVAALQARVLNPRKISVDLEISTDLTVSRRVEVVICQELSDQITAPIHLQQTESSIVVTTGIVEKSFTVNDQLPFPEGEAQPCEIIGKDLQYLIRDREVVGDRLLLRGEVTMILYYFTQDSCIPCSCSFLLPFSQLIDLGDENAEAVDVWIEPTSSYTGLIDSLDSSRLLDVELHALVQARARKNQVFRLITDAYSNQMPCECVLSEQTMTENIQEQSIVLGCDERMDLPEEFREILSAIPKLGPCTAEKGNASVDLLCRSNDGKLFSMRRSFTLNPNTETAELTALSFRLSEFHVRQDGRQLVLTIRAEGSGYTQQPVIVRRTDTLLLDDEPREENVSYPSLTAVWARTESVWELAKKYHSSPEAICALNQDLSQRPVFVPKTK